MQMASSSQTNFNLHLLTLNQNIFHYRKLPRSTRSERRHLHLKVIFKKLIFTLRNNGGKVIFDFCWGETTEALFIANSQFNVVFCHLAFKALLQGKQYQKPIRQLLLYYCRKNPSAVLKFLVPFELDTKENLRLTFRVKIAV